MSAPVAVSLFSGIGGLDLGARAAGVQVVLASDVDRSALSLLHRAQGTSVVPGDIQGLIENGVLADASPYEPDLLFGGPPCTAFSHAGFWLRRKRNGEDPAAVLLDAFVEAVRQLRPRAFLLENVPGLRFRNFRSFYDSFVNRMRRAGYSVASATLDSSHFSVPQARRRLFVVGTRGGPRLSLDHAPRTPTRSSAWALQAPGLKSEPEPDERPSGVHRRWLDEVPPGENYLCLTAERGHDEAPFDYRSRYWSFLLKLHPDKPSWTIPAQRVTWNGPFHWTGRHLRVRELARLQSFPDWQPLDDDLEAARRHIGNAVPPLLAASVVWYVLSALGLNESQTPPDVIELAQRPGISFDELMGAFPEPDPEPAAPGAENSLAGHPEA